MTRKAESGFDLAPLYRPADVAAGLAQRLGEPGEFPFTRGVYGTMYTARPWTMRQYAGFGSAAESNARYHQLLRAGTTGLSVAFDLPTQMGMDSDAPLAHGEVGKVGVAIDSIADMRLLLDGIPLGEVSTSMTINAPAAVLLLLYQLVAEEQGVAGDRLNGTIQNDVLKEYIARGTYIYPPEESLRLVTDTFAYCRAEIPRWNTISVSGYHMAEAGATPAQEVAFTLADGVAYVQAAVDAGLKVDDFAPRLAFFFVSRTAFLEEIAKFRAARRIWAGIMRDEFGATDPRSQMLRFHTQTAGVQLTAQQPEVNLVRVTVQALAAALGGTQSLHTNSFDEAIALPTEKAARLALRTQQVLAYETDITATVDPFAGSYAIEAMTDELEGCVRALMRQVADLGGAVAAIENGFQKREIEHSAYAIAQQIDNGERVVVGVNRFRVDADEQYEPLRMNPAIEAEQKQRLAALRADRDNPAVGERLTALRKAAEGRDNVLYPMREALRARATVGEVCDALRAVWGTYRPRTRGDHIGMSRRRILITGVSRRAGIGFALAEQLSAEADIVASGWAAHDAEQPWGADPQQPTLPRYLPMDLADPDAPGRLVRAARDQLGGLDVLIALHARSSAQSLPELTATELDLSFAVNARATLLLIKQFAAGFDGRDGRVITFSSGQHREPMPAELPYIASKAAVQQLTASLAAELAPRGITVNCVNPGPVDTGYADEGARAAVASRHPRGRWGTPRDVAAVVGWLISPGAGWLTGQTIDADGGWQLRQR